MEAIGKLVKGLDELAGQFFGGGEGKTLADRLDGLQLDDSQLASYSLKLKQSARLSQTYQGPIRCRRASSRWRTICRS